MKVNKFIRTRRSPAFSGGSLYLDGVGDYIDLQGPSSPVFWKDSRTRHGGAYLFRPASWSFWVKFPQSTITQVIEEIETSDLDMTRFIIKETSAFGLSVNAGTSKWTGNFAGLVTDKSGNVRFGVGWGRAGGNATTQRVIMRGSTNIVADTWYHIVWSSSTGRTADGNVGGWSTNHNVWINHSAQTLDNFYPGQGTSQMGAIPCSTTGYGGSEPQFQNAAIGRNSDDYTEMYIAECAFWEGVDLDSNDVGKLYGNGTPLADILSNNGNYDKGVIEGRKIVFNVTNANISEGVRFKLIDHSGKVVEYQFHRSHATGAVTSFAGTGTDVVNINILEGNGNSADMAEVIVKTINMRISGDASFGYPISASPGFQTIYASNEGSQITLELGTGGDDGLGSSSVTNTNGFSSGNYTDITFNSGVATFDTSSGSGSGQGVKSGLMGWWRFKGPAIDPNVSALHISPKRAPTVTGEVTGSYIIAPSWQALYIGEPYGLPVASAALNVGGTYGPDTPKELI